SRQAGCSDRAVARGAVMKKRRSDRRTKAKNIKEAIKKAGYPRSAITAAHTKNPVAWWATWATHNRPSRDSIWEALDGKVQRLANRLRRGVAFPDEIAFAADLIEGIVKPRRLRKGQLTRYLSDEIAKFFILERGADERPMKQITGAITDDF